MTVRVLLAPQLEQQWRHSPHDDKGAMHSRVTAWAERHHQAQYGAAGHPMVHDDGALGPTRSVADAAAVAIALEHRLTQSTEILIVLPFQRVAGGAEAERKDAVPSARTVHAPLHLRFLHAVCTFNELHYLCAAGIYTKVNAFTW